MKLTLKQQWRPRPLNSCLGFMDLKTGVVVVLLFTLLNKVAGVYGLIAVFFGGSFAQLSLYIYSTVALVAFAWGLKAISEEEPRRALYFAHIFFADHILSTAWTVFFAVIWWNYTPHDGRRQANSVAQEDLMKLGSGFNMTAEERSQAALMIWNKEKGLAAAVIMLGWLAKIYFAILIYSYAIHLRKGTYRALPHTKPNPQYMPLGHNQHYSVSALAPEDEDLENFYRAPPRAPPSGSSVGSFADFVSAPGRGRKFRNNGHVNSPLAKGFGPEVDQEIDEVLFDSDELNGHSKVGTETSSDSSRDDDDHRGQRSAEVR